jgi:hypothetical protein
MDYERIASDALLEIVSERRQDFLHGMYDRARSAVVAAAAGEAYRVPAHQRDYPSARRLAELVADHGVDVFVDGGGDFWIPLAHPYSRLVREVLEPQRYPEIRPGPGKDILRPYDIATWTLPLMMGVSVEKAVLPAGQVARMRKIVAPLLRPEAARPAATAAVRGTGAYAVSAQGPEAARVVTAALRGPGRVWRLGKTDTLTSAGHGALWPAGTFILDARAATAAALVATEIGVVLTPVAAVPAGAPVLHAPRVGIYKPWAASTDEGWTRFVLERYGFAPRTLDNAAIRAGKLRQGFDAIIIPAIAKDIIATGRPKRDDDEMSYHVGLPPEYSGGLDKEGARALRDFVEAGGTLIAFGVGCDYVIGELPIPVRNVLARVKKDEFNVPGSLLRVLVTAEHPITWGLPRDLAVFQDAAVAFETVPAGPELQRWVLGVYPDHEADVLRSGFIAGAGRLLGKSAAVALTFGKGKLVLFGFRPQNRGQTSLTFPLVWNALYWSAE